LAADAPAEPPILPRSTRRRRLRPLLDARAYVSRGRSACFVCEIVAGNPEYRQHVVHDDDEAIAFLAKGSTLWGHTLLAPKAHHEHVTCDMDIDAYLRLQRVVHAVGEAVRRSVPCDRLYLLSLGSQDLNRHVHWHVAPLPPGVPLARQQFRAFSQVVTGVLDVTPGDQERLAARLRRELAGTSG
jgi:diadenosine tetraphosphate (Ap4A) HIT family hydrolase